MFRAILFALAGASAVTPALPAQTPSKMFRWETGQLLTYRVEHTTSAAETVSGTKNETKTKLNLTKRWYVAAVDPAGVATIQLSLAALRLETTTPAVWARAGCSAPTSSRTATACCRSTDTSRCVAPRPMAICWYG